MTVQDITNDDGLSPSMALALQSWTAAVPMMQSGYHQELITQVNAMRETTTIYPAPERVLFALQMTAFNAVQVVIVGQDPYHGPGQADGMAFSVPGGVKAPPSLRNIFTEIAHDIYHDNPPEFSTDLTRWAVQGVLLLNASLTVEASKAGSHRDLGWHKLTAAIIAQLSEQRENLVFLLWGKHAQSKRALIDPDKHCILESPHPSPLSAFRGFFGCAHFSQANAYLAEHGGTPVVW